MSYQERSIPKEKLEKFLSILDSDEGIRIDDKSDHIFINKTGKRYCIMMSIAGKDEFVHKNNPAEVIDFLSEKITQSSRIFAY